MNLYSAIIALAILLLAFTYFLAGRLAEESLLKSLGAQELLPTHAPGLIAMLRRLAQQARVTVPVLYILPSDLPNCLVLRGANHGGSVIVTAGLLESLSESELAGILAHQIVFLKMKRVQLLTIFAAYGNITCAARLLHTQSARIRADGVAAQLMGESRALISALGKVDRPAEWLVSPHLVMGTADLFICNPAPAGNCLRGSSHPRTEDRIRALELFALRPLHSTTT